MLPESVITEFARQGLGFLIAAIEGGIILFLLRRTDQKDETIKNRDETIVALQEKRIADFQDNSEKIITVSKDLVSGMTALKETNQSQTNAIMKIIDNVRKRSKA